MNSISPRFVVATACANAPKCRGGKFRRPVHVRVVDSTRSLWHALRGLNDGLRAEWRNVDSRYSGPRSEHGQALRAAVELAAKLNAEHEAAITADLGAGI